MELNGGRMNDRTHPGHHAAAEGRIDEIASHPLDAGRQFREVFDDVDGSHRLASLAELANDVAPEKACRSRDQDQGESARRWPKRALAGADRLVASRETRDERD